MSSSKNSLITLVSGQYDSQGVGCEYKLAAGCLFSVFVFLYSVCILGFMAPTRTKETSHSILFQYARMIKGPARSCSDLFISNIKPITPPCMSINLLPQI